MRRPRVIVYVTRRAGERSELLVFERSDLPESGLHVPAGGLDAGESLEQAAIREVAEETGVVGVRIGRELGVIEQHGRFEPDFAHESHFFEAHAEGEGPDTWGHRMGGRGTDAGVTAHCRWIPLKAKPKLWAPHAELLDRLAT